MTRHDGNGPERCFEVAAPGQRLRQSSRRSPLRWERARHLARPLAFVAVVLAAPQVQAVEPAVYPRLQRLLTEGLLLFVRSFVDLTYGGVRLEHFGGDVVVDDVRLYPILDHDADGACIVTIEQVALGPTGLLGTLGFGAQRSELVGLEIPTPCFQPEIAAALDELGYDRVVADDVVIAATYDLPSAGASLLLSGSLRDAADFELSITFDYLWLSFNGSASSGWFDLEHLDEDPTPVAYFKGAELMLVDAGLWQRLQPALIEAFGSPEAIPTAAGAALRDLLTEGGLVEPSPAAMTVVNDVGKALAAFVAEPQQLTFALAPPYPIYLSADRFHEPEAVVALLAPRVTTGRLAGIEPVEPALLAAALAENAVLTDAARLRIGTALTTGVGAPQAVAEGLRLLLPLADAGSPEALALVVDALGRQGATEAAYGRSLQAQAAGGPGAAAQVDALEAQLDLAVVLELPLSARSEADGEAALASVDAAALRRAAVAANFGRARPRDYALAYRWATLAAAAGDRSAARLRDRLDDRLGAADASVWRPIADAEALAALRIWTARFGAAVVGAEQR